MTAPDNERSLFVTDLDSELYEIPTRNEGPSTSDISQPPWKKLDISLYYDPEVLFFDYYSKDLPNEPHRIYDLFGISPENSSILYKQIVEGMKGGRYNALGDNIFTAKPTAIRLKNNEVIDVFAVGANYHIYHTTVINEETASKAKWIDIFQKGFKPSTPLTPYVVSRAENCLEVFYAGTDSRLHVLSARPGPDPSAGDGLIWTEFPLNTDDEDPQEEPRIVGRPQAVVADKRTVIVFARDYNSSLWHRKVEVEVQIQPERPTDDNWERFDGPTEFPSFQWDPEVCYSGQFAGDFRFDVFVVGVDGQLYHLYSLGKKRTIGRWTVKSLGERCIKKPTAIFKKTQDGNKAIEVFVLKDNHRIYRTEGKFDKNGNINWSSLDVLDNRRVLSNIVAPVAPVNHGDIY